MTRISVTPVRGFALECVDRVLVTSDGVDSDRRFLLVDGEGRRLRSSRTAWPIQLRADYDVASDEVRVSFPSGREFAGSALAGGEPVIVDVAGRPVAGRVVEGSWNRALSALAGESVRLVRTDRAGEAQTFPLTLVSEASLRRLEEVAGHGVDPRRFRMLFTLDGIGAHEEDAWIGRHVAIGGVIIRVDGQVGRCAVTTRDPDTGETDLDALALIDSYRERTDAGLVPFGVGASVVQPGRVSVGDAAACVAVG